MLPVKVQNKRSNPSASLKIPPPSDAALFEKVQFHTLGSPAVLIPPPPPTLGPMPTAVFPSKVQRVTHAFPPLSPVDIPPP